MTCEECRWNIENDRCPWYYDYKDTDYAEDCIDFRYVKFPETAFTKKENTEANKRAASC
jgi:hypothetical protein